MIATRPMGATGARISILGFGVSGPHGGLAPPSLTGRLIAQALDEGVACFDTAPFYGDAERRLGAALGRSRHDVIVSSKVGTYRRGFALGKDFSPASVRRSVENTLHRLRRDRLDLLYLHGPAAALAIDAALADTLAALKADGRVRWIGVCGRGAEIDAFVASGRIDVVQAPLAKAANAYAAGCGFVAIEALRGAARSAAAPGLGDVWRMGQAAMAIARGAPANAPPPTGAAAALARAWATPGVACVMTTTTRAEHLRANVAAARAVAPD